MPAPTETKPRWERRKDARPQELLAAALEQFVERGYAATRLEDVARRAGVSKGTLYLYFENKEELFKAVVRESIVLPIGEAEQIISGYDGSSSALLRVILMNWWNQIGSTKLAGIAKLMMAESGNFPELAQFYTDEVAERGNALITSVLERGIASGEFRPLDAVLMSSILAAPVIMLEMWTHTTSPCDSRSIVPSAYMDTYIDFAVRGLVFTPATPAAQ